MPSYELTVQVRARYLSEQSEPEQGNYAFAYTITIRNTGDVPSQLISRHWVITDADDQVQEVSGLPPGESFEYTSWATIKTPVGTMRGEYFCVAEDGHRFEAPIPEFALVMPRMLH